MKKSLSLVIIMVMIVIPVWSAVSARSGMIVINEVSSTGKYDFIELYNTTGNDLTLGSSWKLADRKEGRLDSDPQIAIPNGTVIPAYGYLLVAPYKTSKMSTAVPEGIPMDALAVRSFAIGSQDEISLFYNDTREDFIEWTSDVNSIGRSTDGSSEITSLLIPTPGKKNEPELLLQGDSPLLINEVCSRGLDYIEIINITNQTITIGKNEWLVVDSRKNDYVMIPEGTTIGAGDLLVIYPDVIRLPFSAPKNAISSKTGLKFGFGNSDSVYLKYFGMIADTMTWAEHVTSIGRLPDGGDTIDLDLFLTPGKPNRD
ncbi:MAG: lamin tail domain-containing protein [Bacteroidetes bacterium]|nr:lamin tail domain-containing protein [Bacteroidota bacterium]